ncbi:hypothetical protein [Singulisphaera sp. GP187]|uniref:hypothetical protein n=1 Tax=Singulisphaera sp. GP187 TaxID=1882752 RepID=UPI00116127FE|nr:hypothetical protein [Singulisphaera sp. GP187]
MRKNINRWISNHACMVTPGQIVDIHVNELDPSLNSQDKWIRGIQQVLAEGSMLTHCANGAEYTLAGCISLRSSTDRLGINFGDEDDLFYELDITPPSIYLFPLGKEPWNDQSHDFVRLDPSLPLSILSDAVALYLEYKESTEAEFRRSLWLVPPQR